MRPFPRFFNPHSAPATEWRSARGTARSLPAFGRKGRGEGVSPRLSVWNRELSNDHADAPQAQAGLIGARALLVREENEIGAADDVLERHEADLGHAAVDRIVAIVGEDKIMSRRHDVDGRVFERPV